MGTRNDPRRVVGAVACLARYLSNGMRSAVRSALGLQKGLWYGHRGANRRVREAPERVRHRVLSFGVGGDGEGGELQVQGAKRELGARGRGSSGRPGAGDIALRGGAAILSSPAKEDGAGRHEGLQNLISRIFRLEFGNVNNAEFELRDRQACKAISLILIHVFKSFAVLEFWRRGFSAGRLDQLE
jgi:hypothetical protein